MIIAECPACGDPVRIPAGISDQATLKCPLCGTDVTAAELFDALPPQFEVIDDPGAHTPFTAMPVASAGQADSQTPVTIETDEDGEGDSELALEGEDAPPAFLFEEKSAPQRDAPAFYTESNSSTRANRARRSQGRNPIITFAGIIVGGLMAFPLAQLVLWWLAGQDNFELGPTVSKFAPFVVPERFHDVSADSNSDSNGFDNDDLADRKSGRDSSVSSQAMGQSSRNREFDNGSGNSSGLGEEVSNAIRESTAKPSDSKDGTNNATTSGNNSESETNNKSQANGANSFVANPDYQFTNPTSQLRNLYQTSESSVRGAMTSTLDGYDSWSNSSASEGETRRATVDEFYQSFQQLGHALVFIDPTDTRARRAADEVLGAFSEKIQNAKLQQFLSNRAAGQLRETQNSLATGIVFTGRIKSMKLENGYLISSIELDDASNTTVEVYGWHQPLQAFRPGAQVAIFGARMKDAKSSLGILDSSKQAIVGGYVLILKRAAAEG